MAPERAVSGTTVIVVLVGAPERTIGMLAVVVVDVVDARVELKRHLCVYFREFFSIPVAAYEHTLSI